ncbi:MAG: glycosyltransferase family 39 protein [Chloroflexota bacterium]|nr:glycosyltransferase family 39 protein [Chloroflexota bacterium]
MSRTVITWLLIALLLRLVVGLAQDPLLPYSSETGGDSGWYLENGYKLVSGADVSQLAPPPLYLIFIGLPQLVLSPDAAVIVIRILQALASVATCYCVYRIARNIGGERAGMIALVLMVLSPVFILETAQITTETLYLLWLGLAFVAYLNAQARRERSYWLLIVAGVCFGLATLTRAALLLFPLGLVVHLLLIYRPALALRRSAVLLVVYALVISTWTIYNLARWERFIIAGEGFASMIYIGAAGWESPQEVDSNLEQDAPSVASESRQDQYIDGAATVIGRDVGGYLGRRISELANAYLQPHGTLFFPGESLRELAVRWLTQERSLDGLVALIQGDAFFPKMALYILHYGSIVVGLLGMWQTRRSWRVTLPLIGFVAYVTLLHLALFALPRYIFPTTIVWYSFAAVWLASLSGVKSIISTQPVLAKDGMR